MRLLPLLMAIVALATLAPAAAAQAPTGTKMACTNGPNFQLSAGPGRISLPDGNDMFMWSYGNRAGGDAFQLPGPVLCVTQGQPVTISLLNNLPEATSISFPGQSGVTSAPGTPTSVITPGLSARRSPRATRSPTPSRRQSRGRTSTKAAPTRTSRCTWASTARWWCGRPTGPTSPTTTRRPGSTPTASTWC